MSSTVVDCHTPIFVAALAHAMAARDGSTHEHAQRVQRYAVSLAREVRIRNVDMLRAIAAAALLHDVGKLAIPEQILNKPGPLTPEEYAYVQRHSVIGADLLASVPFNGPLALIVRHHHESWDGSGYPDRLRGKDIPVGARVLAIVDCYDALTSDRPYRAALSHQCALSMIAERRGTMYDPAITDAFFRIAECLNSAAAAEGRVPRRRPRARRLRPLQARAV